MEHSCVDLGTRLSPSLHVTGTTPAQLSLAVGAVQLTTAPHLSASVPWEMPLGQPLMTGGVLSVTVTVKGQVLELPAPSVALAVTVVVPIGKARGEIIAAWLGWP